MPVYNVEDVLEETLNYLIKQSTKKIEIICVDDGSSDNSLNILNDYAKKYKNIKVLQQNHEGAGAARNKGIKEAKGEYLLFLDSDDIFHKDLCKKSYNRAKLFNSDIVLFRTNKYKLENGSAKFCSKDCYWTYNSGENNSLYNRKEVTCGFCGEKFKVQNKRLKKTKIFFHQNLIHIALCLNMMLLKA